MQRLASLEKLALGQGQGQVRVLTGWLAATTPWVLRAFRCFQMLLDASVLSPSEAACGHPLPPPPRALHGVGVAPLPPYALPPPPRALRGVGVAPLLPYALHPPFPRALRGVGVALNFGLL